MRSLLMDAGCGERESRYGKTDGDKMMQHTMTRRNQLEIKLTATLCCENGKFNSITLICGSFFSFFSPHSTLSHHSTLSLSLDDAEELEPCVRVCLPENT